MPVTTTIKSRRVSREMKAWPDDAKKRAQLAGKGSNVLCLAIVSPDTLPAVGGRYGRRKLSVETPLRFGSSDVTSTAPFEYVAPRDIAATVTAEVTTPPDIFTGYILAIRVNGFDVAYNDDTKTADGTLKTVRVRANIDLKAGDRVRIEFRARNSSSTYDTLTIAGGEIAVFVAV